METTTGTMIDDDSNDEGDADGDGDDDDSNNGNDDYFSHNILHYYNILYIWQYCNIAWYTTYLSVKYTYNNISLRRISFFSEISSPRSVTNTLIPKRPVPPPPKKMPPWCSPYRLVN